MSENQEEKILKKLRESNLSSYRIAKDTGLSNQSIINYRKGKTRPNFAVIQILEQYFSEKSCNNSPKNSENVINGNNNIVGDNSKIDNRQYYSDSPDVLRAQIKVLDERIKEKDAQIKEKDAQIKEKDAQINRLLAIVEGYSKK